eukprot:XP_011674061.1 PREDICTED: calmodulin-lysine N-methyltransferase [Strongylocentrotus purpuratus]
MFSSDLGPDALEVHRMDNIEVIVEKNKDRFTRTEVGISLFFDQYRSDLVHTIHTLLSADGMAVIFAPCRNHTLEKFCQQAKSHFRLTLEENYDPMVWSVYQQAKAQGKEVFDEDIHYPLKITLTKRGHSEVNHQSSAKGQSEMNHRTEVNGRKEVKDQDCAKGYSEVNFLNGGEGNS